MSETVEAALQRLGLSLPEAATPAGSYVPAVRTGQHLYVSGQLPRGPDGLHFTGRCGDGVGVEEGQEAARLCALNILAQVKAALGDFDQLARIVKLTGFVNSTPAFGDQPKVIDGASDLFAEVLGERGRHARSAVGVANLPFGALVEIEAIVEVA